MTIKELKAILNSVSDDAIVLIDLEGMCDDVETITVEYHPDGRTRVFLMSGE